MHLKQLWRLPATARQECRRTITCRSNCRKHGKPSRRYGRKTVQGVRQTPVLCAMVTAWLRQRRNRIPRSAAGRIKRHTQSTTPCCGLQPSSAVVSAAVVGASCSGDRVYPHTAFVLTWFKIKKRQASASRAVRSMKLLCHKGFRLRKQLEQRGFLRKFGGNGRFCQGVDCAHLNDL